MLTNTKTFISAPAASSWLKPNETASRFGLQSRARSSMTAQEQHHRSEGLTILGCELTSYYITQFIK